MDLWQRGEQDVKRLLAAHGPDLGFVRAYVDQSVQEAGGYWEDPNPDFAIIDPSVRAGHIRQWAAGQVARDGQSQPVLRTLRMKVVSFAGLHLFTPPPDGQRIRTRKRPVVRKTGQPMRVSVRVESDPLFGEEEFGGAPQSSERLFGYDPSTQPYEISILMDIDVGSKTLVTASLAAIDWGADDKGRIIYYEEEIPAIPMRRSGPGGSPIGPGGGGLNGPGSGFEDFLGDEGKGTGSDSV